jgi:methionyl-tRNA formyltransferase
MAMERGLDTGPVFATRVVALRGDETAGALRERLAEDCAQVLSESLPGIASGRLVAEPQPRDGAVYAAKLTTADGRLDWNESAAGLARRVRAFNPRPGAHTTLGGERVKVVEAASIPAEGPDAAPGRVVRTGPEGIDVATGEGLLRILRLQLPGRRVVAAREFINATDPAGQILGENSA